MRLISGAFSRWPSGWIPENRKTAGKNKMDQFKPTSISYDQRIFQYREVDEQVSLTLLRGRERIPLDIGNYQRDLLNGQKPTSATLVKKDSGYYIDLQVKSEVPDPITTNKVIGVDLGITDLAATSEGKKFSCPSCGWSGDADFNGAKNIADLGLL
ncbi:MAG: zinc ribbon domain-containing protein [Methanotrichaceae archaeon]